MSLAQSALEEALAHLGAAIMQSVPADDQIIMDHVRAARTILQVVTRAQARNREGGRMSTAFAWHIYQDTGRLVLARPCCPNDGLHGLDPLSGLMIAASVEEAARIDSAAKEAK